MEYKPLYETKYSRIQEIVPLNSRQSTITVAQRQDSLLGDEWHPADVNWPAIGSQESQVTKEFAEALLAAAELADKWTKERCNPAPAAQEEGGG